MSGQKDERLFAPFPIEMDEHPKILVLSDAAFRAFIEGTLYSRRMLTDGFLDERVVLRRWGKESADELSSNDPLRPSWVAVDGGWQIHDFGKHHPLRSEIEAKRADLSEKRAQAGRKGAARRWQGDGKAMANDGSETQSETQSYSSKSPDGDVIEVEDVPKGTRSAQPLPDPFMLTDEMKKWASEKTPGLDPVAETEDFVKYWRHGEGKGKKKKNWVLTWQNRMNARFKYLPPAERQPQKKVRKF